MVIAIVVVLLFLVLIAFSSISAGTRADKNMDRIWEERKKEN